MQQTYFNVYFININYYQLLFFYCKSVKRFTLVGYTYFITLLFEVFEHL